MGSTTVVPIPFTYCPRSTREFYDYMLFTDRRGFGNSTKEDMGYIDPVGGKPSKSVETTPKYYP